MPLTAGLLLAAGEVAKSHGLPWPSDDEIFAATNRAGAYEIEDAIGAWLPAFARVPIAARESQLVAIATAALRLLRTWEDSARGTRLAKHDATPA